MESCTIGTLYFAGGANTLSSVCEVTYRDGVLELATCDAADDLCRLRGSMGFVAGFPRYVGMHEKLYDG